MTLSYTTPRESNTVEIHFLLWDEENETHIAEHGITPAEIRQLLWNRHLTRPNPRADRRITLIGETNGGRILAVALDATNDPATWRPVTALLADETERRLFERYCR